MGPLESVLLWTAVGAYMVSFVSYLIAAVFKKNGAENFGWRIAMVGLGFHTAAIAARWIDTGHPPVMGRFENTIAGAWFMVFLMFLASRWFERIKPLGLAITPFALIMLGYGLLSNTARTPLSPPFQSPWIWIHVAFAWLSYGSFAVAGGLAVAYLFKSRAGEERGEGRFLKRFPDLPYLEDIIFKFILFGFVAQSFMLISGSIWANSLWGSYWSWDPLETWSLVTWLIYGVIIHFRVTLGWKGRRFAWLAAVAIVAEIITFWGIGFISDLHTPLF